MARGDARRPTVKQRELALRLLESQSAMALSTVSVDGSPRVAPLFYLPDEDLHLYWFSSSASEHTRNLQRDPAAAVAVYRPTDDWKQICGVQMRGSAAVVADPARREAIGSAYMARFRLGAIFGAVMRRSRLYEFQPAWLRYFDNSRRFGYKFELLLEHKCETKWGGL